MNNPKLAYSVNEVCAAAGFSRAWLYTEWKAGRGPRRFKLGSRTFVRVETLTEYLRSLEVATNE